MPPHTEKLGSMLSSTLLGRLSPSSQKSATTDSTETDAAATAALDACSIMDKGQSDLPSLPIPPLEQTLSRYQESIRPLTTDEEYERMDRAIQEFKTSGQGTSLDERLREKSKECQSRSTSWLAEWWDDWAYFTHRDSSTFYVNYYFGFQDDPRMPTQTARAALLVSLALEFRQLIAT